MDDDEDDEDDEDVAEDGSRRNVGQEANAKGKAPAGK